MNSITINANNLIYDGDKDALYYIVDGKPQ